MKKILILNDTFIRGNAVSAGCEFTEAELRAEFEISATDLQTLQASGNAQIDEVIDVDISWDQAQRDYLDVLEKEKKKEKKKNG